MTDDVATIRERYQRVLDAIEAAASKGGRGREAVRLVVVTKLQPVETVTAAIQAGAHILGENYPEEGAAKLAQVGRQSGVEWHMIGHIQSRKAAIVAQHFDMVHSLDGLRLAQRLNKAALQSGRTLPVLLELNVGGEASKHGWQAADESRWEDLIPQINDIAALDRIHIRGLMTMPPLSTDPEAGRVYFRRLRRLRDFLARRVPAGQWEELSMGTSTDFAVAVEEGATLVRIGQAILGPRPNAESE